MKYKFKIAGEPEVFAAAGLFLAVDGRDPEGAAAEDGGAGARGHAAHQGHARARARQGEEEVQVGIFSGVLYGSVGPEA